MNKTSHDSEISAQGQQVITVCAFIHHRFDGVSKVFLPKRAATKKFLPNVYNVPGGHVDYGEDELEAMFTTGREANDPELAVLQKGFALLQGKQPAF